VLGLGIAFLVVNQLVYVPRVLAYSEAMNTWTQNWMENRTNLTPPPFEDYGLGTNERIFFGAFGFTGYIMIFIGAINPVVLLASKIIKKVNSKN
jgi:hypothetical protein